MNINALAKAIKDRNLKPDFLVVAIGSNDEKYKVISFMIDCEKCALFIDTKPKQKIMSDRFKILWQQLSRGDWFISVEGGLYIKINTLSGVNLVDGHTKDFYEGDAVYKEQDMKLRILFPQ